MQLYEIFLERPHPIVISLQNQPIYELFSSPQLFSPKIVSSCKKLCSVLFMSKKGVKERKNESFWR